MSIHTYFGYPNLNASEYYYRCDARGDKCFYYRSTNKKIAKIYINQMIIEQIESYENLEMSEKMEILENRMNMFEDGLDEIRRKLEDIENIIIRYNDVQNEYNLRHLNVLSELNIQSHKDWKEWLRKNHTDKGGDPTLCSDVITAGRWYIMNDPNW